MSSAEASPTFVIVSRLVCGSDSLTPLVLAHGIFGNEVVHINLCSRILEVRARKERWSLLLGPPFLTLETLFSL